MEPEPGRRRHLVKRYGLSRLYNTTTLRYVNVAQLRTLADAGEAVIVLDAKTQANITDDLLLLAS